jgi:hypothetical protein
MFKLEIVSIYLHVYYVMMLAYFMCNFVVQNGLPTFFLIFSNYGTK